MIQLGDDPWSEHLLSIIDASPHQATLRQWAASGVDPGDTSTPYVEHITGKKQRPLAFALSAQARFAHLLAIAPNWPKARIRLHADGFHRGPICLAIREDGHFGCEDGFHRTNILHHLGLPISAVVVRRHPEWLVVRGRPEFSAHPDAKEAP